MLHHLTGVDLTQIDGLAPYSALKLIAEIGTDLRRWPTAHHFTAWLTLAPQNRISGGRRLSSKTQPSANRAAAVLRVAAMSLIRSQTALTATARKLAILVYRTLTGTLGYQDPGAHTYTVRRLKQRADTLGFTLLNRETGELLGATVS